MLVLSRKQNQAIIINDNIRITVVSIRGNQVRIGIEAPESVPIFREELFDPLPETDEQSRLEGALAPGRQAMMGRMIDASRRRPFREG